MSFPAKTEAGVPTVVSVRSACVAVATTSVAVAELAPRPWFVALTVTVSEITVPLAVPAATFTTSTTVPLEPAGADAAVQVIVPVPFTGGVVHVVPGGAVIDWNVVLAGVFSVSVGLVAATVPTLVAVCV